MSIADLLTHIPVALVEDVEELLKMLLSADDTKAAVERAKLAVIADAADAVADRALDELLRAEAERK